MVYGTVMDEGVDATSLTSSGPSTAVFHNTGSGTALQAIAASAQPAILGANTSSGIGVMGGSTSGIGVEGAAVGGNGVYGQSTSGQGVLGISTSGNGVIGQSTSSIGVIGVTAATAEPGLFGLSMANNSGVIGVSEGAGFVLPPSSPPKTGVYGYAVQDIAAVGVKGESTAGTGTSGVSATGPGAKGSSTSGAGIVGSSTSSYGVLATSGSASGVAGASAAPDQPGIVGISNGNNTGIFGFSRTGSGVVPVPATPGNTGVYGFASQDSSAVGVLGESTTGTGVFGQAATGTGVLGQSVSSVGLMGFVGGSTAPTPPAGTAVFGASAVGAHDLYAGGSGRIGLLPNLSAGPPTSGSYGAGDVFCDAAGNLWACVGAGSPGSFRKLAGPATAGALHPITPARVYDSRLSDGPLMVGATRTVSVASATTGGTVVPTGAIAVALNLTITRTEGRGWLGLVPSGAPFGTTSSINWFATGQILANGGIAKLGGDRQVDVWSGGGGVASTQFILDITGYFA
jgi:hypothetical protein